jgi:phage baseplate assembly protein W
MSFDLKLLGGDLVINNGDLEIVEDSDKLVQDILKLVSTQLGSNPFFPSYGSPITQALIGTAYDREFLSNITTQQLQSSLEKLQKLQQDQLNYNQVVTPEEQIAAIENVYVEQSEDDPRFYNVGLSVISKAFLRVPISFSVATT